MRTRPAEDDEVAWAEMNLDEHQGAWVDATFEIAGERFRGRHNPNSRWNGFANPQLRRPEFLRWIDSLARTDRECGWEGSNYTIDGDECSYFMVGGDETYDYEFREVDGWWSVGWGYTWEVVS